MRVPKRLHAHMAKAAKSRGVSLNQYVLYLLTERHAQGKSASTPFRRRAICCK